jgi:hypothetical protein
MFTTRSSLKLSNVFGLIAVALSARPYSTQPGKKRVRASAKLRLAIAFFSSTGKRSESDSN